MKKPGKLQKPIFSPSNTKGIKEYFSLLSQKDEVVWFEASGFSMLTLFWPGCRVRMNLRFEQPEIGHVVAFSNNNKLIAHRLIERNPADKSLTTKGDTLHFFDPPLHESDIIGIVDLIDQHGKHLSVGIDPAVSLLSAKLGRTLETKLNWLPAICKTIYYILLFSFGIIKMQILKKRKHTSTEGK
jgi:hypothetical protein